MLKYFFGITLAAALAVGIVYANQPASKTLTVRVSKAPADDGKQMYGSFCAPCHGLDGRGQGPVADSLKQQPANLALLSKNNGGKFPEAHVATVLEFGVRNPSHGTAQMPVWGPMFNKMDSANAPDTEERALRIRNLTTYLRTLQEK